MLLKKSILIGNKTIEIGGSKSISNRLLILRKLFGNIEIRNLSDSQDTQLLQTALDSNEEIIDIHHAGTAMRFLASYFSVFENRKTILTGSERMKQRPIKPLVDALRSLGAEIEYTEKDGFPPLKITGKKLEKNSVKIPADISSQFISSLLLIGAKLENGLSIELIGEITSKPYLEMTLQLLNEIGIDYEFSENVINIQTPRTENREPRKNFKLESSEAYLDRREKTLNHKIESDWSSAGYFYSLAAIGRKCINLKNFRQNSLQGDSVLKEIYWDFFGVNTISEGAENKISLLPEQYFTFPEKMSLNMNAYPDIAQTVCVTATALKIPFKITGLSTLKIKETDRLSALKNELFKIGCISEITDDSIKSIKFFEPNENISIETYNDHRMAMSFAPFCLMKELNIENPDVVEKSYPYFWEDFFNVII